MYYISEEATHVLSTKFTSCAGSTSFSSIPLYSTTMSDQQIFTATSAYSLAFVTVIGFLANNASKALLPRNASWQDKLTFIWLVSQYYARKEVEL